MAEGVHMSRAAYRIVARKQRDPATVERAWATYIPQGCPDDPLSSAGPHLQIMPLNSEAINELLH